MGWNGSGSITLLYDFTTDRDAGSPTNKISADKIDAMFADFGSAIEACLNRNGENTITANMSFANYKLTNLGAATAATDAVRARMVAENTLQYGGTTGGSANAYTASMTFLTAVGTGTRLLCYANFANTGAATLNVNTLGAVAIKLADGATALTGGEIPINTFFEVVHDGTYWRLLTGASDQVKGLTFVPDANDGASLGTAALSFSDLFLASGAVINFNNGDVLITHSANLLAHTGASTGYSFDAPVLLPSGGVINFNSGDVLLTHSANLLAFTGASTGYSFDAPILMPSGGVINFNSGDVLITHSANTLTFSGAASGYAFDAAITVSGQSLYVGGGTDVAIADGGTGASTVANARTNLGLQYGPPGGRLTLTSLTPVLAATVSGATTIYYTPYLHKYVPVYDGTNLNMVSIGSELSQTLADTTKSPAATVQDSMYDLFVWSDSGTIRCTRGPAWITTVTGTAASVAPVASPGVVNWTSHGLHEGSPVVFSTSGALPTGLVAGTTYYVSKSPAANSFKVCSSIANVVAGTEINFTGSTSGNTTVTNNDSVRGTGAGTTELQSVEGVLTNKNAITNGPAANRGTYVGSIRTNSSNQVDFIIPTGAAANCTAGVIYIWNAYNRVEATSFQGDSADTWNYVTSSWRASNGSATARTSFIIGLNEDNVFGIYSAVAQPAGFRVGFGLDATTTYVGTAADFYNAAGVWATAHYKGTVGIGAHYLSQIEYGLASGLGAGDIGFPANFQTGSHITIRC